MAKAHAPLTLIPLQPTLVYRAGAVLGSAMVLAALAFFWADGNRTPMGLLPSKLGLACGAIGILIAIASYLASKRGEREKAAAELATSTELMASLAQRAHDLDGHLRTLGQRNDELEHRVGELEHIGRELAAGHRESAATLAALKPSFGFIDPAHAIDPRFSEGLERVLRRNDLAGKNFLDALRPSISESNLAFATAYLARIFDAAESDDALAERNPLDHVAVDLRDEHGIVTRRYLNFEFRRVLGEGIVERAVVTAVDVTERTLRDQRVRHAERTKAAHFDVLVGTLHVADADLDRFLARTKDQLAFVDDAIDELEVSSATSPPAEAVRQRLAGLLQRARTVCGEAAHLRLERFEAKASVLERRIVEARKRGLLATSDLVALAAAIADFWTEIEELQHLRGQIAVAARAARATDDGDDLIESVGELAMTLAKHTGKSVRICANDFDSRSLPPDRRLAVKDVLVQLVRNSLAHGIETPDEREAAGKARVATIDIRPIADLEAGAFGFTYRDDGRGLDAARIRRRAVASGLLSEGAARAADDSDVAGFIFTPGFTTVEALAGEKGRGLGMNVIKQRIVDDCGGEIEVDSDPGFFCEFAFRIPTRMQHALAS